MAKTIIALGEILWDMLPDGPMLGGAVFNFAYRATTLGDRTLFVSRVGRDNYGNQARAAAKALGMELKHLQQDESLPTGTVRVTLGPGGEPDYFIVPEVAYDNIEATSELLADASECDCVCYGTLVQRSDKTRRALRRLLAEAQGATKFCDINLRKDCHSPETIAESLEWADILKLNGDEATELAGRFGMPSDDPPELAARLLDRFAIETAVITFGPCGALARSAGGELAYVPGFRANVTDTCGSGDAFSAGFLHNLLAGGSLTACCTLGNALGALVATQAGATQVIDPGAIDRFLAEPPERVIQPGLESLVAGE